MHVLHRPHVPRLVSVSMIAAILAIVISLALASTVNNISQPANGTSMTPHRTAPAVTSALHTNTPRWATNPFSSLLSRPLPQPWPTARQ